MKPAEFTYHRPSTVDEAVELLASLGDEVKVLAGGQSLLPVMNMRLAAPEHLVDVTGIPQLRRTHEDAGGARYGAATTHMMLEHSLVPDVSGGLLPEVARGIGYRAIRTRGTLAGSIAHADPSAEWPVVLAALEARVLARSTAGEREIPVAELPRGFLDTALRADELVTEVAVPRSSSPWGFHKSTRKQGEFAESLAVAVRGPDGLRLWLGAARPTPVRLRGTERAFDDRVPQTVDELAAPVAADLGADPGGADPVARHALQLHAMSVHRAVRAAQSQERVAARV